MFESFWTDETGALAAEYALLLLIACGCLAILAVKLGGGISAAMQGVAGTIKAEAEMISQDKTIHLER